MNGAAFFRPSYAEARRLFCDQAASAGLARETFTHPHLTGPAGEALAVDVVRQGAEPGHAHTVILTCSATHGIEGYVGSAAQSAALHAHLFQDLGPGVAVVQVHALNPYGFAYGRRVNEDNVDLNRNFINFDQPRPAEHPHTATLQPFLLPDDWDGPARAEADQRIADFIATHGLRTFQSAVTRGQYRFPDGMYFGGSRPVWSNTVWREILARHCSGAAHVIHLDIHSGLGPYGVGELIYSDPRTTPAFARAQALWGDRVTCSQDGSSTSVPLTGETEWAVKDAVGFDAVTSVTLEFGTVPVSEMIAAVRADNWLARRGGDTSPLAPAIRREIRRCFYGQEPLWQEQTVACSLDVLRQTVQGVWKAGSTCS